MDPRIELNPNEVVSFLGKLPQDFTRADMVKFIREKGIRMIDFMYPAEDGRVKTLNFTVNNLAYVETVLSEGERVDGSSLFPSFIEAGNSDLYVIPRYRTAFVDPFNEIPTLCFLCSFFTKDGEPFDCAPYMTLMRGIGVVIRRAFVQFALLPKEAWMYTDALVRACYRMWFSHRNLLNWVTSDEAAKSTKGTLDDYLKKFWFNYV